MWGREEHCNGSQTGLHSGPAPSLPYLSLSKPVFFSMEWRQQTTGSVYWLSELIDARCLAQRPAHSRSSEIAGGPLAPSPNIFTQWMTLRKLLPSWPQSLFHGNGWGWVQAPSGGDLCGPGPIRRLRHLPQAEVEPGALAVPSARAAPPGNPGGQANSSRCEVEVDHKDR